ncbi:MAG: zinc ABC transporter substrate-binding protein, partial [Kitasatospora sp.]|nr:zinc ABC transporter substrate-binding protein [Kitasatospora sp.]
DPHLWLDPSRLATIATQVGERLATADPAHAQGYKDRAARTAATLATLDQEYAKGLSTCQSRTLVTSHEAFGYLADHYGLEQVAINGVDPEAEPTPSRMAAIQRAAKDNGATTVFFEALVSPKLAETVAADLGLKTAVLDPLEGIKEPDRNDYFSVMRQNLTNLRAALGAS